MDIFNSCSACHWSTATLTLVNSKFVHSVMCCIISSDCSGVGVCDRQWRDHAGGGSSCGPSGTGQGSSRGPPSLLLWAGQIQVSRCQSNPPDPWWSARTQGLPKVSHHNQTGTKNNGDKMFYSPINSSKFPWDWVMKASRLPPAHWGGISKVFPADLLLAMWTKLLLQLCRGHSALNRGPLTCYTQSTSHWMPWRTWKKHSPSPQNTHRLVGQTSMNTRAPCGGNTVQPVQSSTTMMLTSLFLLNPRFNYRSNSPLQYPGIDFPMEGGVWSVNGTHLVVPFFE